MALRLARRWRLNGEAGAHTNPLQLVKRPQVDLDDPGAGEERSVSSLTSNAGNRRADFHPTGRIPRRLNRCVCQRGRDWKSRLEASPEKIPTGACARPPIERQASARRGTGPGTRPGTRHRRARLVRAKRASIQRRPFRSIRENIRGIFAHAVRGPCHLPRVADLRRTRKGARL